MKSKVVAICEGGGWIECESDAYDCEDDYGKDDDW